ncbi:hypothetical protein FA95DRAFT_1676700 [Auriscalpium vulgare]|uniref:Uncharacterized protein n=1 Tax=Auriscalpium vulgare TaxID=40419 RepID=A0ACB8S2X0_9AGAM|nr:hypothetical protein FA95DRAFT_1676700 [Auriscalpium vulgare]
MSDEYASTGFQGSLVNKSAGTTLTEETQKRQSDYATGNYPPPGDTTSSGGYRSAEGNNVQGGLLDRSPSGGQLKGQERDAQQGRDERARAQLNPYQGSSLESPAQAEEALASRYGEARGKVYEGSGPAGNDGDVGA